MGYPEKKCFMHFELIWVMKNDIRYVNLTFRFGINVTSLESKCLFFFQSNLWPQDEKLRLLGSMNEFNILFL